MFIIGGMFDMYLYVCMYVGLLFTSVRVPLIVSLALNKNQTNASKSRSARQEWERKNAQEERIQRLKGSNAINEAVVTSFEMVQN